MSVPPEDGGPWWTIAKLVEPWPGFEILRPYELLPLVERFAYTQQVRTRGRECDTAGQAKAEQTTIPSFKWADLKFGPALLASRDTPFRPHRGDLYWRSMEKLAYVDVEVSEPDILRLWRAGDFTRPPDAEQVRLVRLLRGEDDPPKDPPRLSRAAALDKLLFERRLRPGMTSTLSLGTRVTWGEFAREMIELCGGIPGLHPKQLLPLVKQRLGVK